MLFKYRFFCNNKNEIQNDISERMSKQETYVKGVFGIPLYRKGLNFTDNTEIVKGFYIEQSEWEGVRGSPFRVYFIGKYVSLPDGEYVDFYVYPQFTLIILTLLAIVEFTLFGGIIGAIMAIVVFLFSSISFVKIAKHASKELERMFFY